MAKAKKEPVGIKRKIVKALGLPKELMFNLPVISVIGTEELEIENFKGMIEYTDERIRISTTCGTLRLEGSRLYLKRITAESILINGNITKMEYIV